MLTIFTCPKPFTDPHIRMIQRNAIQSWMQLAPRPEILLMGADEGVAEVALELGLRHVPDIHRNEYGTPLVSDIWRQSEKKATSDILAYVNADMLLGQDFVDGIAACLKLKQFLVVGQRTDLDMHEEIDFSNMDWHKQLIRHAASEGKLHGSTGIDYFVYRKGLLESIPDFALGRCAWDQWLVASSWQAGASIVDATVDVIAIHQNHHYGKDSSQNAGSIWNGFEALRNRELAGDAQFTIQDASYILKKGKVRFTRDAAYVIRRMKRFPSSIDKVPILRSWKMRYLLSWLSPCFDILISRRRMCYGWAYSRIEKTSDRHYNQSYFNKQKKVGEFGGKANLFKFQEYVKPEMTVLDFGCGGGYLLKNLNCARRIGVEINPSAREQAKRLNGIEVHADVKEAPDGICDVIISNHALEHVENPSEILRLLRAKLKAGGKMVFVVPYEHQAEKWHDNDNSMHLYTWSPRNLGNLFSIAGFRVDKSEILQHAWPCDFQESYWLDNIDKFHKRARREAKRTGALQVRIVASLR